MLYLTLKTIHIISSTILFGTGLGSAFYFLRAQQSKNINALYFAAKNVVLADWIFTTPAVIIQPITGFWMIYLLHYPLDSFWIVASITLYVVTGFCWIPVVYIQIKMFRLIAEAQRLNRSLEKNYYQLERWWFILGWPAFISVMIIFYLMTTKPVGF
jgi:uncharacterized membrane protein